MPAPTLPREKSTVPRIQVDVARKVQEDPLLKIRRQEEERKAVLREQLLIQQRLGAHGKKPATSELSYGKRKGVKCGSERSDNSDLDLKLASKLKKLKGKEREETLDEKIAKKILKLKGKRDSSSSSSTSSSSLSSSSSSSSSSPSLSYSSSSSPAKKKKSRNEKKRSTRHDVKKRNDGYSSCQRREAADHNRTSNSKNQYRSRTSPSRTRDSSSSRNFQPWRKTDSLTFSSKRATVGRLSQEEIEKRRKEMMQSAVTREQERKVKVDRYRQEVEEEAGQLNANRPKEAEFVKYFKFFTKHLVYSLTNNCFYSVTKTENNWLASLPIRP